MSADTPTSSTAVSSQAVIVVVYMSVSSHALVDWLRARGGYVHPDLDLFAALPNGDRGVVARAPIAEGEHLVVLPLGCTMHLPTSQQAKEAKDQG